MKWKLDPVTRPPKPDEFALIARFLAPLAQGETGAFGLLDDGAIVDIGQGQRLVATADALIEGVHFLSSDPPELVGRKLLRVNLSDLAAMGATPFAYLLTMALREQGAPDWVEAFARGLAADQSEFGVTLIGGDTTATHGPISLSVTALGRVSPEGGLLRSGARAGDRIFVSGTIGDSAMGLKSLTDNLAGLGEKDRTYLERRYRLPEPRISLGRQLLGLATAAIDVSDGLVGDLEHICSASGVGATVELTCVPMSPAVQAAVEGDPKLAEIAIAGGDDYELLFTAPVDKRTAIEAAVRDSGVPVTEIGTVETGQVVVILGQNGNPLALKHHGYRHF